MLLTEEDKTWIATHHKRLKVVDSTKIMGMFVFDAVYLSTERQLIINPTQKHYLNEMRISDAYRIEIKFDKDSHLPVITPLSNRIEISRRLHDRKSLADMHLFESDKSACLCPPPVRNKVQRLGFDFNGDYSIKTFFERYLTPYFYQQSYFERTGKWPIENYGHGLPAIFEYYYRNKNLNDPDLFLDCVRSLEKYPNLSYGLSLLTAHSCKGHDICPCCKSGRKFRDCHGHSRNFSLEAKKGLDEMRKHVKWMRSQSK